MILDYLFRSPYKTPVGKALYIKTLAPYLKEYVLPKNKFIYKLRDKENKQLNRLSRTKTGWYIKEREVALLRCQIPSAFHPSEVNASRHYLIQQAPELFEFLYPTLTIIPTFRTCPDKALFAWYAQHQRELIEVKTWSDKCKNVPDGKILIKTGIGGDDNIQANYFFVDKKEYLQHKKISKYPFICRFGVHEERIAVSKPLENEPLKTSAKIIPFVRSDN